MEWNREEEPGMVTFINKIHQVDYGKDEKVSILYKKWTAMLAGNQIDMDIRVHMNEWYQSCYKARLQVLSQQDKVNFCNTFMDQLHAFIDKQQEVFKKYNLLDMAKNVQTQVRDGSYVDTSIACIENEHALIESTYEMETTTLCELQEVPQCDNLETDFKSLDDLKSSFDVTLGKLQESIDSYHSLQEKKDTLETRLCVEHCRNVCTSNISDIEKVLKGGKQTQKVNSQTQENVKTQIKNIQQELIKKGNEITTLKSECSKQVSGLFEQFGKFKQELLVRVDQWKDQMKLQYAELYAKPDLETVSKWCARIGQFVHQILIYTWPRLENVLDDTRAAQQLNQLRARLTNDLKDLLCRTFVVSEQQHYILKCDKKNLPTVSVRILAADNRDLHNYFQGSVTAYLVYDGDLNTCWNAASNTLDIQAMKKQAKMFDKNQQAFAMSKNSEYREASFKTLSLKTATKQKQFERASGKHVHEEKYRIVFLTEMNLQGNSHTIWTLSLPVVVTTGANQGLQSQASVMWECFGTDVYKLPTGDCSALPWHLVAEMLKSKMRTLCERRDLSDENMRHLKSRLLGDALRADDTEVTLKQFCFDKMEKSDSEADNPSYLQFSFWKWFMGCYNLIDRYLKVYWKDGLIEGFLSKTDASRKLEQQRPVQDGLFILRFSDTNIVDSQGLNSIFGHLTACVMILRQNASTNRTMMKILDSLDVASSKSLDKKQLANILKDTMDKNQKGNMYKVLFPNRKWEDTFQKHLQEEESQEGKQISGNIYVKPEQSWTIDLDQKLCEIEKSAAKSERRNSPESDMDTHGGKRRRKRTVSDDQLSCQSSQSSWQQPQSPGQWSFCSDASRVSDHSRMSIQSPMHADSDLGSQSPMGVPNGKTVVESVIPNMDEFNTTMIPSVVASMAGDDLMVGEIQKTLESFMSPVSSIADSFQSSQDPIFLIGGTNNTTQMHYGPSNQFVSGNQTMMQQLQGGFGASCSQFTPEVQGQHNFGFTESLQSEYPTDGNNITIFIEQNPEQATSHDIQPQANADLIFEMLKKMPLEEQHKLMSLWAQTLLKSRPSTSSTRQTDSGGSYTLSSGEIQEGMDSGSIDPMFPDILAGSSSGTSN
ncbi:signal transducer and activator of transcription 5B-like isoform X1 [Dreissena polymorpha]|uniref:signal transducer and activator of transcription 5B-like isoform X1 n=1 Tax=Dreissena polymorpha TaxID=45954 RepID=UPI0022650761|nr:signal transducer and activator of transcription 5B-like isoform X1 [Dreissena polymorpha]